MNEERNKHFPSFSPYERARMMQRKTWTFLAFVFICVEAILAEIEVPHRKVKKKLKTNIFIINSDYRLRCLYNLKEINNVTLEEIEIFIFR